MLLETIADKFHKLFSSSTHLELIQTSFYQTEGPVWDGSRNCLFFSDIPGNTLYYFSEINGIQIYRKPSFYSNGLTLNKNFQLIACEHQRRAITIQRGNRVEILCNRYNGKKLNSPNDIIIAKDDSIIFTDPIYGLRFGLGGPAIREQPFQGLFRLPSYSKQPILICSDFERPNGLALNSNESRLFVNDTVKKHIRVFNVESNWNISGGQIFTELQSDAPGRPDGMKIDIYNNLFCSGPGGIWVFDPRGNLLGKIHIPEKVTNLAWGDDDYHSLYITAGQSLYRLRCLTRGINMSNL